jgi:anti-sigma28 factor (negative regulator of flagellin synthesis)
MEDMNINNWKPAAIGTPRHGTDWVTGTENVRDNESGPKSRRISTGSSAEADTPAKKAVSGMSAARLAEIRNRIEDGSYDSIAVADRIARRLIARGEI